MRLTVTKDRVAQIISQMRALADSHVLVGFPGETSARGDAVTNPSLAYIHEFGSPAHNVPARPFLVPGAESITPMAAKIFEKGIKSAIEGKSGALTTALRQVGVVAQDAVQHKIETGPFAPLSPVTIARKGHDKPLLDTRAMRDAVTFVIRSTKD